MTRAVISGYYGFGNLGDEAVLFSMLKLLKEQDPNFEPTVLSADPGFTARTYNVKSVNRWDTMEVIGALRKADVLLSGGGSLLQDVTGVKNIFYYTGIMWIARMLNKPVVFFSQGIGPLNSRMGRFLAAREANRAAAVTVRDEESRAELQDIGVSKDIVVAADPVLGLEPEGISAGWGFITLQAESVDTSESLAGISVRPWEGEHWKHELASACDYLVEKGMQVVFLPMQQPGDLQVSQEIAGMMKHESFVLKRACSVQEKLSVFKNLDLLVGMRLHSLIFAAVLGVSPVGISYDPKVKNFLSCLDLEPAGTTCDLNKKELCDKIDSALSLERQELMQKVEPLKKLARRAAEAAFNIEIPSK
ncbi:MAG: polysaccharide pyruvyl transferase CsaB [Clostridiales bacterium]|nr:polysaccharide pyruvyl transferase CsaB [Clostridiales bacterium]MCF8022919.1 polysaccharide pyruvyl transferase CsaB [Clostridiales bacterium]